MDGTSEHLLPSAGLALEENWHVAEGYTSRPLDDA